MTTAARISAVVVWVAREDVRLLLDNAHLLTGGRRREAVALQMIRASGTWWAGLGSEVSPWMMPWGDLYRTGGVMDLHEWRAQRWSWL